MRRVTFVWIVMAATAHAQEIQFNGFVDAAFLWNANRPANHENFIPGTGTSGKRANELTLNLAQVQWSRAATEQQPAGFTLALVAGEGTKVVHAGEPDDTLRHVYQASLAYRLRNGVVLEAGIYPSHIGMESFYSKDNWNYTRSWLGELSPYYQAGVKASYAFNERWSGQIHLLNGWQIIKNDDDNDKAIGTQLAYANGPLTASFNTYLDRDRKYGDVVVLVSVAPRVQVGGSVDAGHQDDADWRGAGVYARFTIDEHQAIAVRAEHFRDPDNGIRGAAQTLREATLTYELRPHDNLILKLETRYDDSTAGVFSDSDRQFLALAGAVVTF